MDSISNTLVAKYQKRISGPLLDRIDIHVEVPRVEYEKLSDARLGESSAAVRERVEAARDRQRVRFGAGGVTSNADMRPAEVRKFCTGIPVRQDGNPRFMHKVNLIRTRKRKKTLPRSF